MTREVVNHRALNIALIAGARPAHQAAQVNPPLPQELTLLPAVDEPAEVAKAENCFSTFSWPHFGHCK